ncbi:hypothetical protein Ahy_A02g005330 isoform A [Arachis hypogaea]|uniref:DUF4283 domain-containing protein n=1 Tax=Arachis hypogaea TaxID=3818 RepID=A0A445E6D2_ARAHY|nr:hypothetical protein Ahy_A02g005330 isoform A [Arachis hypogaea]
MILEDYIPEDLDMEALIEDQAPFNPYPMIEAVEILFVVKPLEKSFNLQALDRWVKKGSIRVMNRAENFFLVKFTNPDDFSHALFEGS